MMTRRLWIFTMLFGAGSTLAGSLFAGGYCKSFPRVLLPLEKAVCRIYTENMRSGGSGVAFKSPVTGNPHILTANHVVSDRSGSTVLCTWDGITKYKCKVAAVSKKADIAILTPLQALPATIPVADLLLHEPEIGDIAYAFGFGTNDVLRCTGGNVTSKDLQDIEFYGYARSGDSGGPVFVVEEGKPYVFSALWGTTTRPYTQGCYTVRGGRTNHILAMFKLESDKESLDSAPVTPQITASPPRPPAGRT